MIDKWDNRFLRIAQEIATWSKDEDTQVGAVLVKNRRILATGYNGPPPGIEDTEERLNRPLKYLYIEHAERNVLYNVNSEGATIYVTLWPCADCARGLIRGGVSRVVVAPFAEIRDHWRESMEIARSLMEEANIQLEGDFKGNEPLKWPDVFTEDGE